MSGTLQDEKQITVGGFPGREFTFSVDSSASPTGNAITGIARVILTTDRLYQLISLTAADETNPALMQAYFDSFQLAAGQKGLVCTTGTSGGRCAPAPFDNSPALRTIASQTIRTRLEAVHPASERPATEERSGPCQTAGP